MPRSNRDRRRWRESKASDEDHDLSRLLAGWKRTESRGGREWNVQPVRSDRALKEYRCPGCGGVIPIEVPHVVVWRSDGVLGDDADLSARRHWHDHCWRTKGG